MSETPRQHAEAHPGHVVSIQLDRPTTCDHGDYVDPMLRLPDAVRERS